MPGSFFEAVEEIRTIANRLGYSGGVSRAQVGMLAALMSDGIGHVLRTKDTAVIDKYRHCILDAIFGKKSTFDLSKSEASALISVLIDPATKELSESGVATIATLVVGVESAGGKQLDMFEQDGTTADGADLALLL